MISALFGYYLFGVYFSPDLPTPSDGGGSGPQTPPTPSDAGGSSPQRPTTPSDGGGHSIDTYTSSPSSSSGTETPRPRRVPSN